MTKSTTRLTALPAWQKLKTHHEKISNIHMRELFDIQSNRFEEFSIAWEDLFLDYSKNRITTETMQLLVELAKQGGVSEAVESMFKGEKIPHRGCKIQGVESDESDDRRLPTIEDARPMARGGKV